MHTTEKNSGDVEREAHLRHASCFETLLREADQLYAGGGERDLGDRRL